MDTWGILIFVVSIVLYFAFKRNPIFILTSGIGLGIIIGAVWAYFILT